MLEAGKPRGTVQWSLIGAHNMENALAAIAAARHAGVTVEHAIDALESFQGIARRMQVRGEVNGVRVYDDFAHHPTAITTTVDGLRRRVGRARIIAVLEPRSNTMRMGVHQDTLAASLSGADEVWLYAPADIGWNTDAVVAALGPRGHASHDIDSARERTCADGALRGPCADHEQRRFWWLAWQAAGGVGAERPRRRGHGEDRDP